MLSRLSRQRFLPTTVIDVGGNVGQFAVAALEIFKPKILYSFEPNPNCLPLLRRNLSKYACATVFEVALSDAAGSAPFRLNSHSHSSSLLELSNNHIDSFPSASQVAVVDVPVSRLDDVLSNVDILGPCLLKIDVQGLEAHVLRGSSGLLGHVDCIILEASFKPMYLGETLFLEMIELMQKFEFRFVRPVGWLTDPYTSEIIQMDALFVRRGGAYTDF